jgi:hypothetical protein
VLLRQHLCKIIDVKNQQVLPAGLRHPWNQAMQGVFTEGKTGHFKATDECATASGNAAAIYEAGGACITRKHGETHIITFRFKFLTELCVFFNRLLFTLVAFEPARFCHRARSLGRDAMIANKILTGLINN